MMAPDLALPAANVNGHLPKLVATVPAVPLRLQSAVTPSPSGGDPRPSIQAEAPTQLSRRALKRQNRQVMRELKHQENLLRRERKVQAKKVKTGSLVQNLLTGVATAVAMAASSTGMWKLFGDVLHIDNLWVRASLFAVFEIALLSSALRARAYRIDFGTSSIDDKAVWAIAATTGVLASLDEVTLAGRAIRIALPLVAAFLFERLITTERRKKEEVQDGTAKQRINWRISPHRIMVALGLADSTERNVADVDLTRRMAKLATKAHRAHRGKGWQQSWAESRFQKALARADERYGMSSNPRAVDMFRASLALRNAAMVATSPDAVETASPWARATVREQRELAGPNRRTSSASNQAPRVTENVREPRPHNPRRDREVVRTPTTATRSAEDNAALIREHWAATPGISKTDLAAQLGMSRTRLNQIIDQFDLKPNEGIQQ